MAARRFAPIVCAALSASAALLAPPTVTLAAEPSPPGLLDPKQTPTPGLAVGDRAPALTLPAADGSTVDLGELYAKGPVVITFYRGGWCPFCQRAMAQWNSKVSELVDAGGTFVAISPETAEHARQSRQKFGGDGVIALVDKDGAAMRAFKVGFAFDENLKSRYKRFGHDLGAWNASGRWELPAPATFVVDRKGVIRWVFADWDFRKRANPDEVIAQVRKLHGAS
ncbi:MAG: AhpC/TSA family protein [Planctomycetota bacterium]|nr:MAG: AhpC/TSA family protein [Planctomycetota bacterium]